MPIESMTGMIGIGEIMTVMVATVPGLIMTSPLKGTIIDDLLKCADHMQEFINQSPG